MKKIAAAVALSLLALGLSAQDEPKLVTNLNIAIAYPIEAKLTLSENLIVPMLRGEGLMSGNQLEVEFSQEVSPVSLNAGVDLTLTPIAFLQFTLGGQLGSGWYLDAFSANGLGAVTRGTNGTSFTVAHDPFAALMLKAKLGGVFQFDLAALMPGDWNHIQFRTYHEVYYRGLAGVADSTYWQYEVDDGENKNGFNYYANYVLAYKMPVLSGLTIGALLETSSKLYGTSGGAAWGENLLMLTFGPLVQLKIDSHLAVSLLGQWKTDRNYSTGSKTWYLTDRVVDAANPVGVVFRRVALGVDITF